LGAMQSTAAVTLKPLLVFCCVHCSSDSQCFSMGQTTSKIALPLWGSGSNNGFLVPPKSPIQKASWSVHPFLQAVRTWPTDRHTHTDNATLSEAI